MASPCPLLSGGVTDDTLLHITHFLPTARDRLSLKLTCRRFSINCIAATSAESAEGEAAAALLWPEVLSIVEEAGRRWVTACSEQERGWVPRRELESWLSLMHEVELLRLPLAFGRAHTDITLSEDRVLATSSVHGGGFRVAASMVVVRSGRHFAQFTVRQDYMAFGVIRPGWDVHGVQRADDEDGHCFLNTYYNGMRFPGYINWEGAQGATEGDSIGMLLDLNQGSMTVWKNDVKLGVMQAEGLSGPLCWAVSMYTEGTSGLIESRPAPASPTEDELEVAKAWQRRTLLNLPQTATGTECEAAEVAQYDLR